MKIVQLSSENVLRLSAVEITPDGNLIIIGGENAQGKTSVLDSIFLGLGGRKAKHQEPLKQGARKGKIVIKLDDDSQLIVTRTFTPKGSTLTVTSKGREISSPQTMLDQLVGELTFDPLEFSKASAKKQLETLKSLVGLDFTELDEQRTGFYDNRSNWNREVKRFTGVVESMGDDVDVPLVEVSVSGLMEELTEALENKAKVDRLKADQTAYKERFLQHANTIAELEAQISSLKEKRVALQVKAKAAKGAIESIEIIDIEDLRERIDNAEETNATIRGNQVRAESIKELEAATRESEALTEKIKEIDTSKAEQLESATFPIKGLSFDDTGVLFNSVPFAQASSAERLRTSVAMGIALNPDLRVLLIRDGSLLDDNNLKTVAKMAKDADCQIFLERVGKGAECSVIIENGMVK